MRSRVGPGRGGNWEEWEPRSPPAARPPGPDPGRRAEELQPINLL